MILTLLLTTTLLDLKNIIKKEFKKTGEITFAILMEDNLSYLKSNLYLENRKSNSSS
jgi:hypothetical protein